MPQTDLLEGHRILMRDVREPRPVRSISRSMRPYLRALYAAGYVCLAFDWVMFDTVVSLTDEGSQRLERDRSANLTRL